MTIMKINYLLLMLLASMAGNSFASGYTITKCFEGISISRQGREPETVILQKSGHLETEHPFRIEIRGTNNEQQEVDGLEVEFLKSSVFDTYTKTSWGVGIPAQMDITVIASKIKLTANEPIWWELQGGVKVAVKERTLYAICHEVFHATGPGRRRF